MLTWIRWELSVMVHAVESIAEMDMAGVELLTATLTFVWGAALALPGDAFTLEAYRAFTHLGISEVRLGAILMGVGATMFVGLGADLRWLRRLALLQSTALWSFMAVFFLLAETTGAGPYLTLALAAHSFMAFLSLRYREISRRLDP